MERLNLDKFKILAAAATLAMFAGTACAETELFGQVNRALSHSDDKRQANTLFVDNGFSPSGLGVKTMSHLNKCVTVGAVAEMQLNANNSQQVSQIQTTDLNSNLVAVKKVDAWVSGGMWGKLSLGYGDAATYGIARMSYSKTGETVSSFRVADLAGGMNFHTAGSSSTVAAGTNPTVNRVFQDLDGVGGFDSISGRFRQKNRVRWDSEKWNGLSLAVSHGDVQQSDRALVVSGVPVELGNADAPSDRSFTDVAARYEGHFDDVMVSAGLGWAQYTRDGRNTIANTVVPGSLRNEKLFAGSVAAEYKPYGVNAAVGYGNKRQITTAVNNAKSWFVQLGKHFDFTHHGKTHVVLDALTIKNTITNNDKGNSYAIGAVQDLDKVNASVYATARGFKYKQGVNLAGTKTNFDKVWVGSVGVMVKFGAML